MSRGGIKVDQVVKIRVSEGKLEEGEVEKVRENYRKGNRRNYYYWR